MKAEFINPFLQSTVSVLKTMASLEPVPGKPYIKKDSCACGDVSGVVGITGETEGSLCLTFSKPCILQIASRMLREEVTEVNETVRDVVGELTNMISGDSRRRLQELGHTFQGAIPSVITGPSHEIHHVTKGPILSIPFQTQAGSFVVEACFK
ncbi:MAG TPA: chemotaxis protein CheX [Thermodesulfobacteriota bacterium]|nr:chemotaxis protein CheX [Thermodesulfobacteriota bacterium]